jgi:nitrite reductase/ring-hydroxylating ferredoxin subunit
VAGYHRAAALADLPEARAVGVEVDGQPVVIVRLGEVVHAMRNRCAHAGTRFDAVPAVNRTITCPMHGARFDLLTGRCVNAPYEDIPVYPTRVREGTVEVALPPDVL